MTENKVVLPAPFGPTSATIWPGSTKKAARSSASNPPKRCEIFSTRSMSAMGALPAANELSRALEQTGDPARCEGHDQHEHAAIDDEIEPGRVAGDELGGLAEQLHHQRAEQWPEHRADAADDRREQRLDRDPGAVGDA